MINKVRAVRIILIILLLPLLFINVKDSHDWGDDFAQYIIQAKNIIENKPQTENGLIFLDGRPPYAIQSYPVGFPILLAPVYGIFGLQLSPYMLLISIILIITGIICFEFFVRNENAIIAFLITMLFCYNPTVLDLKKQILSELPFTCFVMLTMLWPLSKAYKKKYAWIFTGILFGLLISIRIIGIVVLFAYLLSEINKRVREKKRKLDVIIISELFAAVIVFLIFNNLLFPVNSNNLLNFYFSAFTSNSIQSGINFDYYYAVLKNFFPFWSVPVSTFWLMTAFTGWFIRFVKFRTIAEYFFPLYLMVIVFYPYSSSGYRLLIPILPLLIYYFYYFLAWLFYWFGKMHHKITPAVLGICLLAYIPSIFATIKNQHVIENGPQDKKAIEMFSYLKTISPDVPVMFSRARAMYLYSGRRSLYPLVTENFENTFADIKDSKGMLIVVVTDTTSQAYDNRIVEFVDVYKNSFSRIWNNDSYEVWQL